jgi:hypothetical protein
LNGDGKPKVAEEPSTIKIPKNQNEFTISLPAFKYKVGTKLILAIEL